MRDEQGGVTVRVQAGLPERWISGVVGGSPVNTD